MEVAKLNSNQNRRFPFKFGLEMNQVKVLTLGVNVSMSREKDRTYQNYKYREFESGGAECTNVIRPLGMKLRTTFSLLTSLSSVVFDACF